MIRKRFFSILLLVCLIQLAFYLPAEAQMATGRNKFLGNIVDKGQTSMNFDMYWNQLTPGNAGKWASCEQARDDFNYWLWLDRAYSHAKQIGVPFKLHTLVWGHSSGEPAWMKSVPQNEQKAEVIEWFETVAERYPDVEMVDVVNEPLHAPPSYTAALGGAGVTGWDWVIWCFEKAREVFPNAILILNDYNILNYTNECQNYLKIIKLLQDRGLIDGVGLQGHSLESISFDTIKKNLESIAATGLDIYISEYEARGDDATQLALFKQHFPLFWEHPSVKGVTLWGYMQGEMWRSEAYLLASDGVTERPALKWLREYFNYDNSKVKYRFDTYTDGQGSVTLNPAGGLYTPAASITVTAAAADGYKFSHWTGDKGGSENPTTLSMASNRLLTAHFVEKGYVPTYTIAVSVSGEGTVTQTPQGTTFDEGTEVTLTAVPGENQRFAGWSGASTGSATTIKITMTGNKTVTANFAGIGGSGCKGETAVTMPFKQDGAGEYCWVVSGKTTNINSWNTDYIEVNGRDFTNTWTDNPPASADGKIHIHYLATVSWAHFEIEGVNGAVTPPVDAEDDPPTPAEYTLKTTVVGQGSVTPSSGTYAEGAAVTLTATPAAGYVFSGWSGAATGTAATIRITMDSNKTVTATFKAAVADTDTGTETGATPTGGGCDAWQSGGGCQ